MNDHLDHLTLLVVMLTCAGVLLTKPTCAVEGGGGRVVRSVGVAREGGVTGALGLKGALVLTVVEGSAVVGRGGVVVGSGVASVVVGMSSSVVVSRGMSG